ncbi:MAG: sugar phosphate isomerase/epimerase, partial [Pseudomonadota bacterium]
MKTMQGPAIFLAQFMGDAPFDTMESACRWMADVGY